MYRAADGWASEVAALATASNVSFHETVTPLSIMVKLTYTATFGAEDICKNDG